MSAISCPSCRQQYRVTPEMMGKRLRCKSCGNVFDAPTYLPETQALPPQSPATFAGSAHRTSDEIDYEIFGDDMQFAEITLDPGECVIAEAGAMMYMHAAIKMETVFGDPAKRDQSLWSKVVGAGKRMLTGESIFMTAFTNEGSKREIVAFGGPYPGKIIPLHLDELGGEIICQKDAFLCGARGTEVSIAFQKRIGVGLFGGEGFIMQRLKGDGVALVHAGGTLMHRQLGAGERLKLDTGCLVALGPTVDYNVEFVGGFKNTIFGGEGLFLATVTGPGPVWLQSLPFARLAGRVMANAGAAARGAGKGEGSLLGAALGPLGGMLMGDNDA